MGITLPLCIVGWICSVDITHHGKRDQHEVEEQELLLDPIQRTRPQEGETQFMFRLKREF